MQITTLGYLEYNNSYLMLYRNKKKQDLNAGKWIGVGGHVEGKETPDQCFLREVQEETGIVLNEKAVTKRGVIEFFQQKNINGEIVPGDEEVMHLYTAKVDSDYFDENCNEGTLKWIPLCDIMELNLWEGDRIFLKKLLDGEMGINLRLEYLDDALVQVKIM